MTCHMTFTKLPRIRPTLTLTADQTRFLSLHTHPVQQWQWLFGSTMLRATTDTGATATIWRDALDELVREGLMQFGVGCADVNLMPFGIQHVTAKELTHV